MKFSQEIDVQPQENRSAEDRKKLGKLLEKVQKKAAASRYGLLLLKAKY